MRRSQIARWGAVLSLGICLALALWGWRWAYVSWEMRQARALLDFGSTATVESAVGRLRQLEPQEHPPRAELLYLMGRALRRSGDLDSAFDYLRRARLAGHPAREVEDQDRLAQIQGGKIEDDAHPLADLLARASTDVFAQELYEALTKGYLRTYRFQDALRSLSFWIEWRPQDVDPRMWLAGIWEQMRNWEDATKEYGRVLAIDPRNVEARVSIGRIELSHLNKVAEARDEFERVLQQEPRHIGALLGLAECERRLADPQSAETRLRELLTMSLSPEDRSGAQQQLGQVLLERRELPEALELLTEVVEKEPLNGSAHYTLGLLYSALGRQDEAQREFDVSRKLEEQFNRLTDITTELVSHPEEVELRWEAGKILMDQGMHRDGAAWMATVLVYDPDHRKTHESLAEYYETVNPDRRLAEHHRSLAKSAGPKSPVAP